MQIFKSLHGQGLHKRQKKLRLSGSLCGVLIKPSPVGEGGSRRLTDEVYFCKRNFGYREVLRLPCVKGAVGASRLRDCFYNPPTAARFPNPSRRRLQVCFAHSQIPSTTSWSRTPLGDACKRASHTRKSLYTKEPFSSPFFNHPAPQAHLFSSIFSLLSKKAARRRLFVFFILLRLPLRLQ